MFEATRLSQSDDSNRGKRITLAFHESSSFITSFSNRVKRDGVHVPNLPERLLGRQHSRTEREFGSAIRSASGCDCQWPLNL